MLDLLPYLWGLEGQESYDQEVCRHVPHRSLPGRDVFVPMAGPRYALFLHIPFHSPQNLLFKGSVTTPNAVR